MNKVEKLLERFRVTVSQNTDNIDEGELDSLKNDIEELLDDLSEKDIPESISDVVNELEEGKDALDAFLEAFTSLIQYLG